MKKQLNWKLLIKDIFSVLAIVWFIMRWYHQDDMYRFGGTILMIYLVVLSLEAHYKHYKKERRFY